MGTSPPSLSFFRCEPFEACTLERQVAHIALGDQAVITPAHLKFLTGSIFPFKRDEILVVHTMVKMAMMIDGTVMMRMVMMSAGPDMSPLAYDSSSLNQHRLPVVVHPGAQALDYRNRNHDHDCKEDAKYKVRPYLKQKAVDKAHVGKHGHSPYK